ncbi:MFS transporter [Kibdelosporangium phytohabitans]|uniref:MFS transporter n=1 Tax=Kibdelosporangium phytohabitans TaxID=860235 RepID=A0A0N7F5J3_9PSEU|nr:MFS transporter [Kibdelosporangium phytohabitans]ALG14391.1 MFS transporter [Kibdelosporangium phytohabitans]MBE1466571.1 EmrB/QacA subfamily drug resistance transporter [Kibdelosporangium phytohabitans]
MDYRWRWIGLAAVLVAEAMNMLDSTIVQVAAPAMHNELGGSASQVQWYTAAYTLPFALLLITGGRLGDIAGRRRIFQLGVAVFAAASAVCAVAHAPWLLIAARAVQGAAAALVIPQTFGLVKAMFQGAELSKALGSIGPVMGLAAVCGPVAGGLLTQGLSWHAVFLINLPLSAAVLAVSPLITEDRAPQRPKLDLPGTALAAVGSGLVVYPLIETDRDGWLVPPWLVVVAGLAVLALFAVQQRRGSLIESSLFAGRGFPAALVTSTLFFAVLTGLMLVLVLHMQLSQGMDARTAGLAMVPWSVGMGVASWAAGAYFVPRYGHRVLFVGAGVMVTGVLLLGLPQPVSLVALAIGGCGAGLFTTPFFTLALRDISPQEAGSAAGLLNAVQQLGSTLGVGLLGSVFLGTGFPAVQWVAVGALVATAGSARLMRLRVFAVPSTVKACER